MKRFLMSAVVLFCSVFWLTLFVTDRGQTRAARPDAPITFSNQVVRLMQQHCQACHHQDGIAPFPLITYADALPRARSIKAAVASRDMPDAVSVRLNTGCTDAETFEGPRRLTDQEIATFVQWVDADAPEGDPADLPPPLTFKDGTEWQAGNPDFVFPNTPHGFAVPAQLYRDIFRRFPLQTDFDADRYLTGFEVLPGTGDLGRRVNVVHHVTLFIDPTCGSLEQERAFAASHPEVPGPGFEGEFTYPTSLVGMWFPGTNPLRLQDGIGIKIPRGACVVMEVHYTTWHPERVTDLTLMGLKFARTPVLKERLAMLVRNEHFVIPAGNPHYRVDASLTFDEDVTIFSAAPHMHQFGTDFLLEAELPSGEKKCMIDVDYDFKHQGTYIYKQPLRLPAGTTVRIAAFYDNSENNPRQLNHPPIDIPFGRTSDHEMCQVTLGMTYDHQQLRPLSVVNVSAASFAADSQACESIVAAFGTNLATQQMVATDGDPHTPGIQLPNSLGGTIVKVKDSAGVERSAPLFFVSPLQVNYQIPPETALGPATVTVTSGYSIVSTGTVQVERVAPGLFAANADGQSVAAAYAVRVKPDGQQSAEPVGLFDAAQHRFVCRPVDLGPEGEEVFLVLFGTGLRFRSSPEGVRAKIGGLDARVDYAGAQGDFVGLDQANVLIPRGLLGRGEIDVALTVDGKTANQVRVSIK